MGMILEVFQMSNKENFIRITRTIKIGNVIATVILLIFIIQSLIGVN